MTPEQQEQFKTLLERVNTLERAENNDTNELHIENLIKRKTDVVDTDVQISTTIGEFGGTVNHLDFPDLFIEIKYKGVLYRVPVYETSRFI